MMILCSTIGGMRGTLVVLSEGFNSDIPCKVTYIGTLDIETVHGRCALIHHIDCNKKSIKVQKIEFHLVLKQMI